MIPYHSYQIEEKKIHCRQEVEKDWRCFANGEWEKIRLKGKQTAVPWVVKEIP